MSEIALHKAVAAYLNLALPADCFWTTFPSGGGGKVRGAQLKAMGLRAGVPDLLILRAGWWPHWIELKAAKGRASIEQKLCHTALERAGCFVAICRSVDDVQETLLGWGLRLRARAA